MILKWRKYKLWQFNLCLDFPIEKNHQNVQNLWKKLMKKHGLKFLRKLKVSRFFLTILHTVFKGCFCWSNNTNMFWFTAETRGLEGINFEWLQSCLFDYQLLLNIISILSQSTSFRGTPGLGMIMNSLMQFSFPGADLPLVSRVMIGCDMYMTSGTCNRDRILSLYPHPVVIQNILFFCRNRGSNTYTKKIWKCVDVS